MKKVDFDRLHNNCNIDDIITIDDLKQCFVDILTLDLINNYIDTNNIEVAPHMRLLLDNCSLCALLLKKQLKLEDINER